MRLLVAAAAAALLFAWARASAADYLEIRRSAWLKETPASDGVQKEKLEPDTLVSLESDQQENGYYSVKTRAGTPGFVYRTLVRRHAGDLSAEPAGGGDGSGTGGGGASGGTTPVTPIAPSGPLMRVHLIDPTSIKLWPASS